MKKFITISTALCAITFNLNASSLDLDGKTIQLKSKASGNCIQLAGNQNEEGTKLIQYPCEENELQELTFSKTSDSYYTINLSNAQELTVPLNSVSNGVNILQSQSGTEFKLIEKENGFALQAKHSNKYLSTTSYNTDIVQMADEINSNQLWKVFTLNTEPEYYGSCKEILDAGKANGSGTYTIDPDGEGSNQPFKVFCEMSFDGGGWTGFFEQDIVSALPGVKGQNSQWEISNNYNYYNIYNRPIHVSLFEGENLENIKVLLRNSTTFKYRTWNDGSAIQFQNENNQVLLNASGRSMSTVVYETQINPDDLPLKYKTFSGTYKRIYAAIDCENNNDGCPSPSGAKKHFGEILVR